MPTDIDFARLAAFIDGEGCIEIATHRQFRKHLGRVYERMYLKITIVNTDPRLGIWCKKTFGGFVWIDHKRNPNWRSTVTWNISAKKAADVIEACLPYLILKREQAEVALAFQATVHRNFGRTGHPKETMEFRAKLQKDIAALKHKRIDFSTLNLH